MASELELAWGPALRSGLGLALVKVLGLMLGLEPASQLVRELGLALVMVFLERLASGSVGRVERVQSQHCCSAC